MSTQEIGELIESVNDLTQTVAGKMGEIDNKVSEAEKDFENFKTQADDRYALQTRIVNKTISVEGSVDYWYPVFIKNPDGASFIIRRDVHTDEARFGQWNGYLEFAFRASDRSYGSRPGFFLVDMHLTGGKQSSRKLPEADYPFIGKVNATAHSPYDAVIWLRGETLFFMGSDNANIEVTVNYAPNNPPAGFIAAAPIPVTDGVDPSVPAEGYIRGEAAAS